MRKQKSNAIPGTMHSVITTNAAYPGYLQSKRNGSTLLRSISNKGYAKCFNKEKPEHSGSGMF